MPNVTELRGVSWGDWTAGFVLNIMTDEQASGPNYASSGYRWQPCSEGA